MMLRCQDLDNRELIPSATTCHNLRSDKVCNYLFHEVDKKTGRRDVKCNLQGLEDIAESCRKTCGICCEDINYACEDDKNGIIDCSRQLEKCHQKKWFGVLSRFCAGSCGLCVMTSCRDYDNSCRVRKSLCLKSDSVDYMRENCARTCGFCVVGEENDLVIIEEGKGSKNNGKPVIVERPPISQHRLTVPDCSDKVDNCTSNSHLCGSPVYGEYMIKFCTKTCLKCDKSSKTKKHGKTSQNDLIPPSPFDVIIQPLIEYNTEGKKEKKCEDLNEKCQQWKKAGLCNKIGPPKEINNFQNYFDDIPQQYNKICPKSCGICF
ncbi:hypothetical protein Mgra_00005328 [Meloidogyne graminicola]|uniref:ShKT domain-containing protein n=1 Tax=Meloidogyne graminicola TaxID=189291 RepID=A0A8S9ZPR6_9BILA|nr:hypothetical protein Mgra_00005328 [Meloidogyne graminicola]